MKESKGKEDVKAFEADEDYWLRTKFKLTQVRELKDDREKAWKRPFYGAVFFALGFYILLTAFELYPTMIDWIATVLLSMMGGLGMGWGMYWMST